MERVHELQTALSPVSEAQRAVVGTVVAHVIARLAQSSKQSDPAEFVERAGLSLRTPAPDNMAADALAARSTTIPVAKKLVPLTDTGIVRTEFGGLFYLLAPALELGLGEMLWRACVLEASALSRLASAILGEAGCGDPAPTLFGGIDPHTRRPVIHPEQQYEAARALLRALVEAIPRRGIARLPEVVLGLTETGRGRLLAAAVPSGAFSLFAWPSRTLAEAEQGLKVFLSEWPASAPTPRCQPGLAELDGTARVVADYGAGISPALLLPQDDDLPGAALLAQCAGTLCHLFAARAKSLQVDSPSTLVARHFAVPAQVELASDAMTVRLPMERIDIALRRAGLDRDPGWVPWLRKTVRLEFVGNNDG
jgi:hypothetical protein